MALRGKQPEDRVQRLKLLLSSPAGIGKTTAAIQMPKCYVIDCERGSVHYGDLVKASGGLVYEPTDMHDLITEVRTLMTEKHDFRTLVIDPITTVYHALGDEGERKIGTEFSKNYKLYADKFMRRLMALLAMLDMNVIMTAHTKNLWGKDSKGDPTIIGQTFDGYVKLDYVFDLYLQLDRELGTGKRFATVVKSRFSKEFPDMDRFEWSYQELAKRFGKERLEKGTENMALATPEQVNRFKFLLNEIGEDGQRALKIDKAVATVEDIADLPAERIAKGIEIMEKHLAARNAV